MEDKNYTDYYKYLAIAVLVLGFLLGIALGDCFKISIPGEDSWDDPIEKYNSILMLVTWVSSMFLSIIFCFMFSVCKRLDNIAIKTNNTNNKKKQNKSMNKNTTNTNTNKGKINSYGILIPNEEDE